MITNIEDYFTKGCGRCVRFETIDCSVRSWAEGLELLRKLCLSAGLTETVKWGHPCYTHAGRNIVIIGAFRENYRLSFFNASLIKDPDVLLEKQGPNTQQANMLCFDTQTTSESLQIIITGYLKEAMDYAEAGLKPIKTNVEIVIPEEMIDAMDFDPELAEAFHQLTPGRQRSYVIHLNSAKTSKTRINRIEKFRSKILAGKGFNER